MYDRGPGEDRESGDEGQDIADLIAVNKGLPSLDAFQNARHAGGIRDKLIRAVEVRDRTAEGEIFVGQVLPRTFEVSRADGVEVGVNDLLRWR